MTSISDEAVEAAAEALHNLDRYADPVFTAAHYIPDARAALEAAAPHLVECATFTPEACAYFTALAEEAKQDIASLPASSKPFWFRSVYSRALREAASAFESLPPMLKHQAVATLKLYADEPWRLRSAGAGE